MNFLGNTGITIVRRLIEATLGETWTIYKRGIGPNTGTGPAQTPTARAENIPARSSVISDRSGQETVIAGAAREKEEIILTVKISQAGIAATDRAVCTAGTFAGRGFEVVRELTTSHKTFCRRFLCKAV